jgi:hypothetical protein
MEKSESLILPVAGKVKKYFSYPFNNLFTSDSKFYFNTFGYPLQFKNIR